MPRPLLCATVTATTMAELLQRRDAVTGADLVELRLDGVADVDVAGALAGRRLPVIVTCRAAEPGRTIRRRRGDAASRSSNGPGTRRGMRRRRRTARPRPWWRGPRGRRIVLSHHDFTGGVADAASRLAHLLATGAEVVKVAVTVTTLGELAGLAALGRQHDGRSVVLAMGEAGRRLARARRSHGLALDLRRRRAWPRGSSRWPACATSSACRRSARAPRCTACSAGRCALAVAGDAQRRVRRAGLDAVYLPLAAADFADFEAFADAFGVEGASVTAPFKVEALAGVAAAPTIAPRRSARSTRCAGRAERLGRPQHRRRRVPGAARRARRCAAGARRARRRRRRAHRWPWRSTPPAPRVTIHARRAEAAAALAGAAGVTAGPWPPAAAPGTCSSTPRRSAPRPTWTTSPIAARRPPRRRARLRPRLQPAGHGAARRGRAPLGCRDDRRPRHAGRAGAAQFDWWTGITPPDGVMREAALARLEALAPAPHATRS